MDLADEFIGVVTDLLAARVDFAVCGGFAMAIHGFSRFTKDIDLLVQREDLERVMAAVANRGFDFDAGEMQFGVHVERQQSIRRINKVVGNEWVVLDLLIVGPTLVDVWKGREFYEWNGMSVPVVSSTGLAKMKRRAGRPLDLIDIEKLGFNLDDPYIQSE